MKGVLIVMEGLDGCGKNTQTHLLCKHLKECGEKVNYLSFPNYNEPSSALIKMYLNRELGENPEDVNTYATASFFAVDRFASYKKNWGKIYNRGEIIICDRYTTSNTSYQMAKLPRDEWEVYLTWLYDYEYNKLELPKPDKVIYLNMPLDVSQNLMEKRYMGDKTKKDINETNVAYLKKCEQAAQYVAKRDNWHIIECVKDKNTIKSKESVHSEVISALKGVI